MLVETRLETTTVNHVERVQEHVTPATGGPGGPVHRPRPIRPGGPVAGHATP